MFTDTSVTRDRQPLFWPISPNISHKKLKEISERNCFWSADWKDRIKKLSDQAIEYHMSTAVGEVCANVWTWQWLKRDNSIMPTYARASVSGQVTHIAGAIYTGTMIFLHLHGRREAESKMSCRTKSDGDRSMRSPARQPLDWSSRSFQFVKNYLKFGKKSSIFFYHIIPWQYIRKVLLFLYKIISLHYEYEKVNERESYRELEE